ncbi:MAG: type II toxin-antitoxin system HicB family antitoxin [Candidatus Lambdaproteobacteria bacterium]|nr:type II toxin-antitoxin system HicB family antitoxin [Candidatus Lambdaproteobacteria bacterium]
MDNPRYTMIIEPAEDDQGPYFGAYFPDLPGCGTTGRTLEDLRHHAREALEAHIGALRATGQPVPRPSIAAEEIAVDVA